MPCRVDTHSPSAQHSTLGSGCTAHLAFTQTNGYALVRRCACLCACAYVCIGRWMWSPGVLLHVDFLLWKLKKGQNSKIIRIIVTETEIKIQHTDVHKVLKFIRIMQKIKSNDSIVVLEKANRKMSWHINYQYPIFFFLKIYVTLQRKGRKLKYNKWTLNLGSKWLNTRVIISPCSTIIFLTSNLW